MISIDFQGGAHGNFLEFVCNVAANVDVSGLPFNSYGASHNKQYLEPKIFVSDHYSFYKIPLVGNRVIAIKIQEDDLLPLSQVSLLRAGDYGYDNNELEIDTYNKLNNQHYSWVLKVLIDSFFARQIKNSYDAVKDPSWPDVDNLDDFNSLPEYIKKECAEMHNLELLELSPTHPDCPRHILREFFQIGFQDPQQHGFMVKQQMMKYKEDIDVFEFPFSAFYNRERFLHYIEMIAKWAGLTYTKQQTVAELHSEFLLRHPYKDSKYKCDRVVQQLINNEIQPPELNLLEEAYINAVLEKKGYERRY